VTRALRVLLPLVLASASGPAAAGDLWTVALPLGLPQFVQHRPVAGSVYALVQGAGVAGVAVTTPPMVDALLAEDPAAYERLRLPNALAVTALAGGWFVSAIDALHARDVLAGERAAAARAWDAARPPRDAAQVAGVVSWRSWRSGSLPGSAGPVAARAPGGRDGDPTPPTR
jgi:hypothetical protein